MSCDVHEFANYEVPPHPPRGLYVVIRRPFAVGDTTFNEWEQALAALLSYEFKCKRQAEWQLFGDDTGTLHLS